MRVVVIRHAKAVPAQPGRPDLERPLAPRGIADAQVACDTLRALDWPGPVVVLVSPAIRTRMTYEAVLPALPAHEHRTEPRMAQATAEDLEALIEEERDLGAGTVVLVGHNPGLHDLVARSAAVPGFPTCAIAVIEGGELASLDVPRADAG